MEKPATFSLEYTASPVCANFHNSEAFVRGIKGPIGSGKSVACCMEIFKRAREQAKGAEGTRKTRWAVVRNTGPELETTTIKTWLDWFPERVFGKMNRKPPITHHVRIQDMEMEVIFLALDRPDDVKKLLSLELTGIWFNEAKFMHKNIIDAATGRVGRYPSKKDKPANVSDKNWPTWFGVIMDTNPPDDDHWWYRMAEVEAPAGWEFFSQPSGLSKEAENRENLPKNYYEQIIAGKDPEWISVFVHGQYGTIQDGKPVYGSSYKDSIHCVSNLKAIANRPLHIGLDFGNTPAGIIEQDTPLGQWRALEEITSEDCALKDFAKILKTKLATDYPGFDCRFYGDPSGCFKDQHQKTAFDIFRSEGIKVMPAPSNKLAIRKEGVISRLNKLVNGEPGFVLDGKKCPVLRKGFNGGYKFRKLNVSGTDRYMEEPEKNQYSHIQDAHQYVCLSTGEYREITLGKKSAEIKTHIATNKWSVF
jgi:hypothetical protein